MRERDTEKKGEKQSDYYIMIIIIIGFSVHIILNYRRRGLG